MRDRTWKDELWMAMEGIGFVILYFGIPFILGLLLGYYLGE